MDDLTKALGTESRTPKRPAPFGRLAAGIVGVLAAVAILWVALVDDPDGGEPTLVVAIDQTTANLPPAAIGLATPQGGLAAPLARSNLPVDPNAPALQELRAPGDPAPPMPGAGPDGVVIRDPNAPIAVTLAAAPEAALVEDGPDGPLPRIGADGRRPFDAYARPAGDTTGATSRIAIVVGGLGISESGTADALARLPGAMTLAFAPYGNNLARWVAAARGDGHEVLLQLPLEPFDYPNNDPGPHTLLADATAGENEEKLDWLLSRMGTYPGVLNYMGARFTAEDAAMTPLLDELGRRGLMYLDDRSSSRSRAAELASGRLPFAAADLVIDTDPAPAAIDARIAQLEQIARERGFAVGVASAFPTSVDRLAAWAGGAAARGLTLVPVTSLARDPVATASARTP